MKCPACGLINPESALNCDCGYNFDYKKIDKEAELSVPKADPPNTLFKMNINMKWFRWILFSALILRIVVKALKDS